MRASGAPARGALAQVVAAAAVFDYRAWMSRILPDAPRPGRFAATAAAGRAPALIGGLPLLLRLART